MGRIYLPHPAFCLREMSPFERLLTELFGALPEDQAAGEGLMRRRCDATRPYGYFTQPGRKMLRAPWYHVVEIGQFRPEDIETKVEGDTVVIHARREERRGEDFDVTERRRVVKLPEDISKDNLAIFMSPDGRLVVRAPYLESESRPLDKSKCCEALAACRGSRGSSSCDSLNQETETRDEERKQQPDEQASQVETSAPLAASMTEKNTAGETRETSPERADRRDSTEQPEKKSLGQRDEKKDDDTISMPSVTEEEIPQGPGEDHSVEVQPAVDGDQETIYPASSDLTSPTGEDAEVAEITGGADTDAASHADGADTDVACHMTGEMMEESVRRLDDGLRERFEVSLRLGEEFAPENISVKFLDQELHIDAQVEEETDDGVFRVKEVHRRYLVPDSGRLEEARADVNREGVVSVVVPLDGSHGKLKTIPIVELK